MNGAVETRSNWKGLNAGLREVPSMAAMSFAVVGEGEDARNTRERALKSDGDERHPLRFGCPRNVAVSETIYLRGETWKAPQKLARKRKTDCVCAQTHRAPGVPYPLLSRIRIRIRISLKWEVLGYENREKILHNLPKGCQLVP